MVDIKTIRVAAAAVFAFAAHAAVAQNCTTVPLGNGFTSTTGNNGTNCTTAPLGNDFTCN